MGTAKRRNRRRSSVNSGEACAWRYSSGVSSLRSVGGVTENLAVFFLSDRGHPRSTRSSGECPCSDGYQRTLEPTPELHAGATPEQRRGNTGLVTSRHGVLPDRDLPGGPPRDVVRLVPGGPVRGGRYDAGAGRRGRPGLRRGPAAPRRRGDRAVGALPAPAG